MTGSMMSPTTFAVPAIHPSRRFVAGDGGTTSATGLPRRVMRRGFFVLLTSSSRERHLALNSEIAISCITIPSPVTDLIIVIPTGQLKEPPTLQIGEWGSKYRGSIEVVRKSTARRER